MRCLIILVLAVFGLSACAHSGGGSGNDNDALHADDVAAMAVDAGDQAPVIDIGDRIDITILGEDDLSGPYTVSNQGDIMMPWVGDIGVEGFTPQIAANKIADAFRAGGYLISPQVTVEIEKNYYFSIIGEVMKAGEYPYRGGMTVLDAVAKGGGFTYRADEDDFTIMRKDDDGIPRHIAASLITKLRAGDVVRVRERYF